MYEYDIEFFDEIDSTNNEAKRRINSGKEYERPLVLAAHAQTAGRGRQGKSFYSPKGSGIYLSVVCPMNCAIAGQVTLTSKTAVAVSRAIEDFFGAKCAIKWVNDIIVRDRKCCGILCEAVNDYENDRLRFIVIGVGVNVSTTDWPADIAQTAGSIRSEKLSGEEFIAFAEKLASEIIRVIYAPDGSEMDYYRSHSFVTGKEIRFIEDIAGNVTELTGTAAGIDDNGGLIVKLNGGEVRTLDSGEITVRVNC